MQAAHYGAPVILVTGDEAAVAEAHDFLGEVECVAVKRGIGRNTCEMYDPEQSRQRIREAAKRAVEPLPRRRPAVPGCIRRLCRLLYTDLHPLGSLRQRAGVGQTS